MIAPLPPGKAVEVAQQRLLSFRWKCRSSIGPVYSAITDKQPMTDTNNERGCNMSNFLQSSICSTLVQRLREQLSGADRACPGDLQ